MEAEVSQRHVSFLESGRSQPGRAVAAKLATALKLSPEIANGFMAAAGYAPMFPVRRMSDPEMAPLRSAAAHVLHGHLPYPAVLIDVAGDLLDANPAFDAALSLFGSPPDLWERTHGSKPHNLYRLTLHPEGTAAALVNFEEVTKSTLQRMIRDQSFAPRLKSLVEEIVSWDGIDPRWAKPIWAPPPAPITAEHYKLGGTILSVFAVTTMLGTSLDAVASGLRVESYFPADDETQQIMERLEV